MSQGISRHWWEFEKKIILCAVFLFKLYKRALYTCARIIIIHHRQSLLKWTLSGLRQYKYPTTVLHIEVNCFHFEVLESSPTQIAFSRYATSQKHKLYIKSQLIYNLIWHFWQTKNTFIRRWKQIEEYVWIWSVID